MRNAINKLCGLIGLLALLTVVAACGQKGPLFLPGDATAVRSDIPGQYTPEPSADDTDDSDNEDNE